MLAVDHRRMTLIPFASGTTRTYVYVHISRLRKNWFLLLFCALQHDSRRELLLCWNTWTSGFLDFWGRLWRFHRSTQYWRTPLAHWPSPCVASGVLSLHWVILSAMDKMQVICCNCSMYWLLLLKYFVFFIIILFNLAWTNGMSSSVEATAFLQYLNDWVSGSCIGELCWNEWMDHGTMFDDLLLTDHQTGQPRCAIERWIGVCRWLFAFLSSFIFLHHLVPFARAQSCLWPSTHPLIRQGFIAIAVAFQFALGE